MDTIRAVHHSLNVPYLCPQYVSMFHLHLLTWKKNFRLKFSFFNWFTQPPPTPNTPNPFINSQTLLSVTKVFCRCSQDNQFVSQSHQVIQMMCVMSGDCHMFRNSVFDWIAQLKFSYCFIGLALVGTSRPTCLYTFLAAYKLNETGKLLTF